MKHSTFMHIASEAWWLLLPILLCGFALALGFDAAWPFLIAATLALAIAQGFRDSDRQVPPQPLGLITPLDGTIVHRRECHDPYLDRAAIRLTIKLDRTGVYYFRAPAEGVSMELKVSRKSRRSRQASWIRTGESDDIVMAVSKGSLLGQRPCNVSFGQRVGQGRRCGLRRLARSLDIYIPTNCRVDVALGDKVRAGTDVLATMVHNAPKLYVV